MNMKETTNIKSQFSDGEKGSPSSLLLPSSNIGSQEATMTMGSLEQNPTVTSAAMVGFGRGSSSVSKGAFQGSRKRGRPRKNEDGKYVSPSPNFSRIMSVTTGEKRSRGRPRGSGKQKLLSSLDVLSAVPGSFTPHSMTAYPGEDIISKLFAFSEECPRPFSVLTANGQVSSVGLLISDQYLKYEGRFELLNLSATFSYDVSPNSHRSRRFVFRALLSQADGKIFGGPVAGPIIAASRVEVIIGSFLQSNSEPGKGLFGESSGAASGHAPQNQDIRIVPAQIPGTMNNQVNPATPTSGEGANEKAAVNLSNAVGTQDVGSGSVDDDSEAILATPIRQVRPIVGDLNRMI